MLEQVLKVLEGHTGSVNAVAISTDGGKIVSGSKDKTVRVWSAETGEVPVLAGSLSASCCLLLTAKWTVMQSFHISMLFVCVLQELQCIVDQSFPDVAVAAGCCGLVTAAPGHGQDVVVVAGVEVCDCLSSFIVFSCCLS